jgi:hypothetical protein
MSTAVPAARVASHRRSRAAAAGLSMTRVRQIGYAVLALQLAGFVAWSTILYSRFALTIDFTEYQQAWFLIAHGDFDPYMTQTSFWFWQNHCELMMWLLAWSYWVWPHAVTLLWLQDIFVVGAEVVAFTWICELAQRRRPGPDAKWLAATGLLLIVANPWTWWALSWDYHSEPSGILFALLLARDLSNNRRRAWAWLIPLLACGDVSTTYVVAIGIGALLAGRRWRAQGAALVVIGISVLGFITLIHGNLGSGGDLQIYGYLTSANGTHGTLSTGALVKGVVSHPLNALNALWSKRVNIWANISPSGLPGFAFPWMLPLGLVVMAANNLYPGLLFSAPGFQNLALYIVLPIGTVAVLSWLTHRRRRLAIVITALVVAQAIGYSAVWLPRTFGQWMRVTAPAASTLASIEAQIPGSAEVIASQGILGRFADRRAVHALYGPGPLPLDGSETWIVIAPLQGLEALQPAASMQLIAELAGPLHATLIAHANGVWAFRWQPPHGTKTLVVPDGHEPLQAWTHPGAAADEVMTGPAATWHVTSQGSRGYVSDGIQWMENPGTYQADVTLSSTGPINVEVWNDTCNSLLSRRAVPSTRGVQSIDIPVTATRVCDSASYSGWGPFRASLLPSPSGQRLEVRVWSPGGETVNVYRAGLTRVS